MKASAEHIVIVKLRNMTEQKYYIKQREALLNDPHRRELMKKLFELYANALPIVLLNKSNTYEVAGFSNEVEEHANEIRVLIRLRDKQILTEFINT